MARLNAKDKLPIVSTHEGGKAARINPYQQLRRSLLSCLLWENEFYEDGEKIADRIVYLAGNVRPHVLASLAIEARHKHNLRHAPLLLLSVLCRIGSGSSIVSETIAEVITRADELSEFLAVYAKLNGTTPDKLKPFLSAQAKKGLAKAFRKFDEYQLAKYDRDGPIKLRDALFLCHAKPKDAEQDALWKKLIAGTMDIPYTWETELSAGKDKKKTFEDLISRNKLGYLALLRNLRGMVEAGVDEEMIKKSIVDRRGADRVLPFRYVAAARAAPSLEPWIDSALCSAIEGLPKLKGKTVVLVDVSGSMRAALSSKSDLTRMDAACTLASIINAENLKVFSFSSNLIEVPPRRGMSGVDAIRNSQKHDSTRLKAALEHINATEYDRVIVITDEQSQDGICDPKEGTEGYLINVASACNGVGYGRWKHIDGFSENVIRYIYELENSQEMPG